LRKANAKVPRRTAVKFESLEKFLTTPEAKRATFVPCYEAYASVLAEASGRSPSWDIIPRCLRKLATRLKRDFPFIAGMELNAGGVVPLA